MTNSTAAQPHRTRRIIILSLWFIPVISFVFHVVLGYSLFIRRCPDPSLPQPSAFCLPLPNHAEFYTLVFALLIFSSALTLVVYARQILHALGVRRLSKIDSFKALFAQAFVLGNIAMLSLGDLGIIMQSSAKIQGTPSVILQFLVAGNMGISFVYATLSLFYPEDINAAFRGERVLPQQE